MPPIMLVDPGRDQRRPAGLELGLLDRRRRRRREIGLRPRHRLGDDRSVALDQEHAGKAAAARRLGEEALEAVGISTSSSRARSSSASRPEISVSSDCAWASTKAVAILAEFSTMALVLVENQLSRPRSSVTLATTATRIAGVAATMLKRATIRIWRRAAARRRLPGKDQRRDLPADDQDENEREARR